MLKKPLSALVRFAAVAACLLLIPVGVFWLVSPRKFHAVRYSIGAMLRGGADYHALEDRPTRAPVERELNELQGAWPEYRGSHGNGVHDEGPLDLAQRPELLWRASVGPAYSSMVIAGGLVITMEQLLAGESVSAFDLESGELVWAHAWEGLFTEPLSKDGPRATPLVAGDTVVALGATGPLVAVDLATGEERWRHDLLEGDPQANLFYGLSASPRRHGDLVLAQTASSVLAFELATGDLRWSALDEKMAYATPQLADVLGERTLLVATAQRLVALVADTGEERWSFPWNVSNDLTCTQPIVVASDRVLLSGGYGKGSQLVSLSEKGGAVLVESGWRSPRFKMRWNEAVVVGEHVFGLDEGVLACLDPVSGKRLWKGPKYGYGQLLAHGQRLIVVAEDGDVHVVEVGPDGHEELLEFPALEGEMNLNVPAIADGRLCLRNEREMLCFDLRPQAGAAGSAGD